ncbi:MAG: hypothetical protein KGM17_01980 [Sphingomonadales bacterium]|nr:hypothetical protein [Sphingomonadales bacterium]
MPDTSTDTESAPAIPLSADSATGEAKARFAKAIEEAKAGASALGKVAQEKASELGKTAQGKAGALGAQAQERAGEVREQLAGKGSELLEDAKVLGGQAKEKAAAYADTGKAKASDALSGLGRIVADSAELIDEKLGVKYGDYARGAARSIHETAAKLDAKDLGELGEDAKEFVRKSPGVAVGIAAVAGFMLARLFRRADD